MFFAPALVTFSALVAVASASDGSGPKIKVPAKDQWWVAQSSNVLTWDCATTQRKEYNVLIQNDNPSLSITQGLAIFPQQQDSQCSKEITQQAMTQPAGTGYKILFTNPFNNTDVWSESEVFEIKPLGSPYPSQVTASSGASAGASGTAGASSSKPTNSAFKTTVGYGFAAAGALLGLIIA